MTVMELNISLLSHDGCILRHPGDRPDFTNFLVVVVKQAPGH